MGFFKKAHGWFLFLAMVISFASISLALVNKYHQLASTTVTKDFVSKGGSLIATTDVNNAAVAIPSPAKKMANPPTVVKAIYMTGWSAGSKNYLAYVDGLMASRQINAVVVDVKDGSGVVSYYTGAPLAKEYKAYHTEIANIDTLVNHFHDQGIYVIGRVAVFEDPVLAKHRPDLAVYDKSKTTDAKQPVVWQNNGGLAWTDPASKEVWDYNIEIAKDALAHGFDEINFDYIRFPTDGNTNVMGFPVWNGKIPKNFVIKSFFQTLRQSLSDAKISADIFGQVTSNTDDMGIGQIFEDTLPYFDYVSPMVYPSHYINGFLGYKNPADHPYEIITYALNTALARKNVYAKVYNKVTTGASSIAVVPQPINALAKIRPWLQDFNLGAVYTADMVAQEIKATTDATGSDFSGYLIWSPSNIYDNIPTKTGDSAPK